MFFELCTMLLLLFKLKQSIGTNIQVTEEEEEGDAEEVVRQVMYILLVSVFFNR